MEDTTMQPGATFADVPEQHHGGAIAELGQIMEADGDRVIGRAELTPEMWIPGTEVVRTSVLAAWADGVTGVLASLTVRPTITVTLDLEIDMFGPLIGLGDVRIEASVVKLGRQVTINRFEVIRDGDAHAIATGIASFMASPNPDHVMPEGGFLLQPSGPRRRLSAPFAERAGITHPAPCAAEVPWRHGNLNATSSINGGLIALVIEEAALSAVPGPHAVTSMSVRYLRPFRDGSARATVQMRENLAMITVESTTTGKLGAAATARVGLVS